MNDVRGSVGKARGGSLASYAIVDDDELMLNVLRCQLTC